MTYREFVHSLYGTARRYEELTERQVLEACAAYCNDPEHAEDCIECTAPALDDGPRLLAMYFTHRINSATPIPRHHEANVRLALQGLASLGALNVRGVRRLVEADIRHDFETLRPHED